MPRHSRVVLSVVIPLYNEEETIPLLFQELNSILKKLPIDTEVILIDDGSTDNTLEALKKEKLSAKKKIISFSRNFGHQAALYAGLCKSAGLYTITMDGDLQHPLKVLPKMVELSKKGYDVILTKRIDTNTPKLKAFLAKSFYFVINSLSGTEIPVNSSDFRCLSRKAMDALLSMPEKRKFLRGMVSWIGFQSITIEYKVSKRKFGSSKYSLLKMLQLGLHGLTSFSVIPLYLGGFVSILFFISAFLYGIYVVYIRFVLVQVVAGWTSVILVVLISGGMTSLLLGLIGVYLAAIYEELKSRPLYLEKNK